MRYNAINERNPIKIKSCALRDKEQRACVALRRTAEQTTLHTADSSVRERVLSPLSSVNIVMGR